MKNGEDGSGPVVIDLSHLKQDSFSQRPSCRVEEDACIVLNSKSKFLYKRLDFVVERAVNNTYCMY